MPKLTKSIVDRVKPAERQQFVWDGELAGFGLRVMPSGRRSFIVQYRTNERRSRRRVVGTYPVMTVEQARRLAREWLVAAQRGDDPAEGIDRSRRASTVEILCRRYLDNHGALHSKPKSYTENKRLVDSHILPALGIRKAASVSHGDVDRLHKSLKDHPYQANRVVDLLSTVFNMWEEELRHTRSEWTNPCRKVTRFKEHKRRRYLSEAELARLGETLAKAEVEGIATPAAVAAIRLLIFTGCRRSEILTLTWDQVVFELRKLALADSKTGAKDIHLPPPAIEVLQGLRRIEGNPYVIPGRKAKTHLTDLKSAWQRLRWRGAADEVNEVLAESMPRLCEHLLPAGQLRSDDWCCASLNGEPGTGLSVRLSGEAAGHWSDEESGRSGRALALIEAVKGLETADAIGWARSWLGLGPGLETVRIHDLRHSFASVGAGAGLSLPIIGALLGHSQPSTTARYAHLAKDPLQQAADLVGQRLADAMAGDRRTSGDLIKIKRGPKQSPSAR